MTSHVLGMVFGLINTAALHLAKGMQLQGIETLRWRSTPRAERSGRKAAIYILGVILNNTSPVWLILANRFAAPAYATGMFGVGIVILMLYSHFILGEHVAPINYLGAALIVAGTALFGIHAHRYDNLDVSLMSAGAVSIIAVLFVVSAAVVCLIVLRRGSALAISAGFGLFAGGVGSLDPVLKALGQNAAGAATIVPSVAWGWIPYIVSFGFGVLAFVSVQFAFHRGAIASSMIPIQTSTYVLLPVVVQLVALPGYTATMLLWAAVALLLTGIAFTQAGPRQKVAGEAS
jgi:drug/metabolite transporter (DMT)-like permease